MVVRGCTITAPRPAASLSVPPTICHMQLLAEVSMQVASILICSNGAGGVRTSAQHHTRVHWPNTDR